MTKRIIDGEEELKKLREENKRLKSENASMMKILNSKRFRVAEKAANTYNAIFPEGTIRRKVVASTIIPYKKIKCYKSKSIIRKVQKIISGYKRVIVMHSIPWNTPLRQRPHHLARCLANDKDTMVIYLEPDEQLKSLRVINKNFITVNSWELIENLKHLKSCHYYFFFNNVSNIPLEVIEKIDNCGYELVYEYIDEFHEDISGSLVNQLEVWNKLPEMDLKLVLASANKLYDDARKHFKKTKILLSKNAVNVEDFNYNLFAGKEVPSDLKKIINNKKPIVGYYGALAHWLDYDLISKVAKNNSEYDFVLMGVNYQNALEKLDRSINNIYYLGPKKYDELPLYSSHFDVAIIPFQTGQIAKGTSPVKLFEYMAMGLPTVGTKDLEECKGYDYVYLAKNATDFSKLLDKAIEEHKKENVRKVLLKQAEDNSWQSRADDIIESLVN